MRNKFYLLLLISIFLIIFYIFYKGLQNPNIYEPKNQTGKNIPVFEAKIFDTNTKINSNKIFEGKKFYLVNIWASWCVPCRYEHPFLINLSKLENIKIIGINYKDKDSNAKNFLNELSNPYKIIISDKDGTIAIEWGAYGVPESFLIYDNKIIKKIIGPINKNKSIEITKLIK